MESIIDTLSIRRNLGNYTLQKTSYPNEKATGIYRWLLGVGAGGFEPPTPCTPCRCANRAALRPDHVSDYSPERLIRQGKWVSFITRAY
jgi:hypothetical protein